MTSFGAYRLMLHAGHFMGIDTHDVGGYPAGDQSAFVAVATRVSFLTLL